MYYPKLNGLFKHKVMNDLDYLYWVSLTQSLRAGLRTFIIFVEPLTGIEPVTYALRERRSTN